MTSWIACLKHSVNGIFEALVFKNSMMQRTSLIDSDFLFKAWNLVESLWWKDARKLIMLKIAREIYCGKPASSASLETIRYKSTVSAT